MSSPARSRPPMKINSPPVERAVVFDQAPILLRRGARSTLERFWAFILHLWKVEPTSFIEFGAWLLITIWSVSLLAFGIAAFPPRLVATFEGGPYATMAVLGLVISVVHLVVMVSRDERARARMAFVAAVWIGGLATSLIVGDYRIPGGLVYLSFALMTFLPCWRVWRGHRI